MKLHKNISISGLVQGVGFRYAAKSMAKSMGIKGFVKNLPNNTVYVEAEGTALQLSSFINWCHKGPPHARIHNVEIEEGELREFKYFDIKT